MLPARNNPILSITPDWAALARTDLQDHFPALQSGHSRTTWVTACYVLYGYSLSQPPPFGDTIKTHAIFTVFLRFIFFVFQMYSVFIRLFTYVGWDMSTFKSANPARQPVDVLRVRYWYQGIIKALGCSNAYQIEKRLEPERFKRQNQRTAYPNKWGRYAIGEHTPQARHVRNVDAQVPGSAQELNHPLWAILKVIENKQVSTIEWMSRLDPAVQACVLQPRHDCFGAPRVLAPFNLRQGRKLQRRGNLDALAALVLYWSEADRQGNPEALEEIGHMIFHMLLIVGQDFRKRGLGAELFALFADKIFHRTPWMDGLFAVDARFFDLCVHVLHGSAYTADDPGQTPEWRKHVRRMLVLLSGIAGFDLKFALQPFCLPQWDAGPPPHGDWARWEETRRFWAWGWHHIRHRVQGKFPPEEAFIQSKTSWRDRVRPALMPPQEIQARLKLTAPGLIYLYGQWPPD